MTPLVEEQNSPHIKIESPSVTAASKKAANQASEDLSGTSSNSSGSGEATLVENFQPAKSYADIHLVASPTKSKL